MVLKGCGYVNGYLKGVVKLWVLRDVVMLWVFKGCGYAMGI
jgi:hypothetical protein